MQNQHPATDVSPDKTKKLAIRLARQAEAGEVESQQFKDDLVKYYLYQAKCFGRGKKLREGKHPRILAALIAALLEGQRALALRASAEHVATRGVVQADGDVTRCEIAKLGAHQVQQDEEQSGHHKQNVDVHLQNALRIEDMRAATGAQIKQLLPQAIKRTIINRHAFARAKMGCY